MATTAQRIKEALELRGMKQIDLVEKTKISKGALSSYISGNYIPKQKNIYLIAKALNVSESWLMGLDVPMERNSSPSSDQAFLTYLSSLGYNLYRDDPEHKPFMSSESISSCKLEYDTLDSLKLQIDSFTKATVDSELLALKEKEIRQERLDKERILQQLREKNIYKGTEFEKERYASHLETLAAHDRTDIEITDEMKQNDKAIVEKVKKKYGK